MSRRGRHDDDAAWLAHLRTGPGDGAAYHWEAASGIGVMPAGNAWDTQPLPLPAPSYRPPPPAAAPPPRAAVEFTEPAVIGDQLRLPVTWCDMPGCISWHRDPAATGFRDDRDRALAAGWRADAWGRLACPACQQTCRDYRTPRPAACHNPEVRRRWHAGEHVSEETAFRLGIEAELSRRISREDPALAADIAAASVRAAGRHHRTEAAR